MTNKPKNQHASELGKLSHKKSPRSKEFYEEIGRKGGKNRWKNKEDKGVNNLV